MLRSYQYRLYPTAQQRRDLGRVLEIHRTLYNDALTERRLAWKRCRTSIGYCDQANQLQAIRAIDEDAAWCNYSSLQQTLRRLDQAFAAFFRRVKAGEKPGYPRYKGKGRWKSVRYAYGDGLRLREGRLYVQHVGLVRLFQHRPIPDEARIKQAVLQRDRVGNWFVIFALELPDPDVVAAHGPAVGIDVGLASFAALSSGEVIENPRWFRSAEDNLATLQRRRARCTKGSGTYRELTRRIRRLHERVANRRRDFQHKVAARIVAQYGLIAVEEVNIQGLARSHVSKSIADAGWGQFLTFLSYKAEKAGRTFVRVSPNGTSQECSGCGCRVEKTLGVRVHACPACGLTVDRDVNAALNVLARGRRVTAKCSEAAASVGGNSPLWRGEDVTAS